MSLRSRMTAVLAIACGLSPAAAPAEPAGQGTLLVLVHGFGRTGRDMRPLAAYFTARGDAVMAPTLPSIFGSLEECVAALDSVMAPVTGQYARIHFVGHSMGGLVIRAYLARKELPNLGRCVLIGTPNGGSPLAGIVYRWIRPLVWIAPAYHDLMPPGPDIALPLNYPPPEIGVVAGNGGGLWLGSLLEGANDGRVTVAATRFPGMTGHIVLPYHHEEIHHRTETAEAVARFLDTGEFPEPVGGDR